MLDNLLYEYKENLKNTEYKLKNTFFRINDKMTSAFKQNYKRDIRRNIINYFKGQIFLNHDTKNKSFIFMTITIYKNYNIMEHFSEPETIKTLQQQNTYIQNYINQIFKHHKAQYINVKELTKIGKNLHAHLLIKIDSNLLYKFIRTIYKKQQELSQIGTIDLKLEKDSISDIKDIDKHLYSFYNRQGKELVIYYINENEIDSNIDSGKILTLDELSNNKTNNILNYMLKYIKKNMENTKHNTKNQEHTIFKALNIKKLTFSNKLINFNLTNKVIEHIIIDNYYTNRHLDKDAKYKTLLKQLKKYEKLSDEKIKELMSYKIKKENVTNKKEIILGYLDNYDNGLLDITFQLRISDEVVENNDVPRIMELLFYEYEILKEEQYQEKEQRRNINVYEPCSVQFYFKRKNKIYKGFYTNYMIIEECIKSF